jgi:polyhydroxybutyrate depolymerase
MRFRLIQVMQVLLLFAVMTICATAHAQATRSKMLPPYVSAHRVTVDGVERRYYRVAPVSVKATQAAVFMFHGHGGSPEHMLGMTRTPSPYVRWLEVARRQNLLLIVPEGEVGGDGKRGWADCRLAESQPKTDDLAFVDAMIAKVNIDYPAITKQIFAVGTSNSNSH